MSAPNDWALAFTLARRELRGGLKGFRIFIACLALGVAAISGVAALSSAVTDGLSRDGRALLGGDVTLRLIHYGTTDAQQAWIEDNTAGLSEAASLRASAFHGDQRRLVELKAVDGVYPLFGTLELAPQMSPAEAMGQQDGVWGAVAEINLLDRLGMEVGDTLRVGTVDFELRAVIQKEPDRHIGFLSFGPRVMISQQALAETGLVQPGSLINYDYKLALSQGESIPAFRDRMSEAFPDAGWRVRDVSNAAPGVSNFVERLALFLGLVGLTSLLVGGIGIANGARSHIESKTITIATLKSLGAPGRLVFRTYLIQMLAVGAVGIVIGLVVGALTPMAAAPLLSDRLPFTVSLAADPYPFVIATAFGLLTTFVFALWPLSEARRLPASRIFRGNAGVTDRLPAKRDMALLGGGAIALAALILATAAQFMIAVWFLIGAVGSIALLSAAAAGIRAGARKFRGRGRAKLRLALANLHRPGAATGSVTLSLGLGLTVLVLIAQIEGNLSGQIRDRLPEGAPSFFFLDIQPNQREDFYATLSAMPTVKDIKTTPMLRGRVTALKGVPADEVPPPADDGWFLRGDRGLTYSATPPDGTQIVAGEWWPEDYSGPPLVSLTADIANSYGLELGDTVTINVLGRDITAEISSLREVDWGSLNMNFTLVFAPGLIERAPHTLLAVARAAPEQEEAIDRAVGANFENVSAIRVREAVETANTVLKGIADSLRATAGVTLIAGVLVLAGAVASGHRRRLYESVVLKTLGAKRSDVVMVYALEYGVLGLATAVIAAIIGTVGAWAVLSLVMNAGWQFVPEALAIPALGGVLVTLGVGFVGTWRALGQKAAPLLRNE